MADLWQDLRHAFRSLRKAPGFAAAAIIVMALGIGANTAIFSVVNTVLLQPLPFAEPSRLVHIWHIPPPKSFPGMTKFSVSPANYFDWAKMNHVFESSSIFGFDSFNVTGSDKTEKVNSGSVSPSFFSVLGTQPILGRTFTADEDQPERNHEVVLSHAYWRQHFGGDKNIVGRQIQLDGEAYTVVGVMPAAFTFPAFAQIWTPLALTPEKRALRGIHDYLAIARLKPGVTLQQANAELSTISQNLAQAYPADDKDWGAMVVPLRDEVVGDVRPALLVLLSAVLFVLLIACANVANLLLARTLARRHELAIRVALGASRRRLLQQVLAESVVVSLLGGALGLIMAHFGIALIVAFLGESLPRSGEFGLNPPVLLFTLGISLLTGVIAGLVPALRFAGKDASEGLKQGVGRSGTESGASRTRAALVVVEVALSLMLLVGAGLMVRTLWNLQHLDPGFDTQNTLSMHLEFAPTTYSSIAHQSQAMNQILQRVKAAPGVKGAGMIISMPLTGGSHQPVQAEGHPVVQMSEQPEVAVRIATPGYIDAMGIPLQKGRDLSESDTPDRPGAVLISASLAKQFWPNEDPIGKHLTLTFMPSKVREVVGLVGDVKQESITSDDPSPTIYLPLSQAELPKGYEWRSFPMYLVVRSDSKPGNLTSAVINAVHEVDPHVPVLEVLTIDKFIGETLQAQRLNMTLLVAFAVLALTLAAVGIYSVLAYAVRRRVREIGIRMALGAQVNDILRLIFFQGLKPALMGVVIGLGLSLALGRGVASMIYGVSTADLTTLIGGSLLLLLIAATASLIPSYRATRVEPAKILHQE
ncbi:MAG: ABC transporter permease [Terriglobales bacterium]